MKTKLLASLFSLAFVLTACGSPAISTAGPATSVLPAVSGNQVKINIAGFAFDPATITIKVGETVTWTNQDSVTHTVVADDKSWTSGNLSKGDSYSHKFDTAGTFTYKCGVHPTMKGTVIVQS